MKQTLISFSNLEQFLNDIKKYLKLRNPNKLFLNLIQKDKQTEGPLEVSYDGEQELRLDLTPHNLGCLTQEDIINNAKNAETSQTALKDDKQQLITNTYIKKIEVNNNELIITKGDDTLQSPKVILPNKTYDNATINSSGLLSALDKQKLDSIEWKANEYKLQVAGNEILGGVKTTSNITDSTGLFPCPIIEGVPYYGLSEYSFNKDTLVAAEGIIKGENIIDGSKYENFSISYNDENSLDIEIAKLIMNKNGLTIFGDTATTGTIETNIASNDYAELRDVFSGDFDEVVPGMVFTECAAENDTIQITTERLMPIPMVYSDTYGMLIGVKSETSIPIAISGRVLVYPYENKEEYCLGDAVCSAPNGKVSKMTREEIKEYPDRILGYVSCIPDYNIWIKDIEVKDRIWIKIK